MTTEGIYATRRRLFFMNQKGRNCCLCPGAASFDGLPLYIFAPCPTISFQTHDLQGQTNQAVIIKASAACGTASPIGINFLRHGPLRAPQRHAPRAFESVADAEKR